MAYEKKEGSGALFKNEMKTKPNHPDYRGTVFLNGVDMDVAGWMKTSQAGKPYMSLNVQPKRERSSESTGEPVKEEDLPF